MSNEATSRARPERASSLSSKGIICCTIIGMYCEVTMASLDPHESVRLNEEAVRLHDEVRRKCR